MNTISAINGGVVERFGRRLSLTMGDMAVLQDKIPIEKRYRPFVSFTDVVRFCGSPQGVQATLLQAARKFDSDVTISEICDCISNVDQLRLVSDLIGAMMGDDSDAVDADETEVAADRIPLAEARSGTGG